EPRGLRADRAAAQPRAQPRLSRADHHLESRGAQEPAPRPSVARVGRGAHAERARGARALRLHGDARRERGAARRAPTRPARPRTRLHGPLGLAPRAREPWAGGKTRGGASLTKLGEQLIENYDTVVERAMRANQTVLGEIARSVSGDDAEH